MENFIFGIQNIAHYIKYNILLLFRHQLVWGFAIGFAASTLVHLFIVIDNPRHLPKMLTKSASLSFNTIAPRDKKGTYLISYSEFQQKYNKVRIVFYTTILVFLVIVMIALLRD